MTNLVLRLIYVRFCGNDPVLYTGSLTLPQRDFCSCGGSCSFSYLITFCSDLYDPYVQPYTIHNMLVKYIIEKANKSLVFKDHETLAKMFSLNFL